MTDQRLRDGGMWYSDEPQVTSDGYREDWGVQQATARFGPTCDGVARRNNPKPPGPAGQSHIRGSRNNRLEQVPRLGEQIITNEGGAK